MKLSLIIPVYNIEEYLPTCIDSILNQVYDDYELILINDGSQDQSGSICDDYALQHNKIKVFHQKNKGVSVARNFGIENAVGEWICFVDGDDVLQPNSVAAIMKEAENHQYEMMIARSFKNKDGVIKSENYKFDESFLATTFDGYSLMTEKSYKRGSVCGCFFKPNFLKKNKLKFPIGLKIGEDSLFISLVYLYAQQISFVDQAFYLINEREGSASRSWTFEKVYKMTDNIKYICDYLEVHTELNRKQRSILHYSIYGAISSIFNHLYTCFSFKNYYKIVRAVHNELNGKLNTGEIAMSQRKISLLNFSLTCFGLSVIINERFRQLTK
jgi:glycosyltransferase involved in cell wall biosynthesis